MKLVIHERPDDITHVALSGRLDATEIPDIEKPLAAAVVGRKQSAMIDISGIEFISSLGIGLLFANCKKLKQAGHKLVLVNPQGMVKAVLKSSGMSKIMPFVPDLDEAVHLLTGVAPFKPSVGTTTLKSSAETAPIGQRASVMPSARAATDVLSMSIKNDLSELKNLYDAVATFLKKHSIPYRPGYAVNLALEELVVNIIRHAFFDDETHLIGIELCLTDEQLLLRIEDDGRKFDPRESTVDPRTHDDPEVGGLGLILVLDIVDGLKYERVENKNRVEVRVRLHALEPGLSDDSINLEQTI